MRHQQTTTPALILSLNRSVLRLKLELIHSSGFRHLFVVLSYAVCDRPFLVSRRRVDWQHLPVVL